MIVDFTISNYRSIREKQTFSLFAESSSNHLADNIARPDDGSIGVLRTAGVYGANASGKSNLLLALYALQFIACSSGDLPDGDPLPCYDPFLLDNDSKNAPTEFEIEFFAQDKIRHIYKVKFVADRILSESLDYFPARSKANLFRREENETWDEISFGGHYKGGRKKFAFFPNNSYLAKAGNSADAPKQIRLIFNYFRRTILHVGANSNIRMTYWKNDQKLLKSIEGILSNVDAGINKIYFEEQDTNHIDLPSHFSVAEREKVLAYESKRPMFIHHGKTQKVDAFSETMESSGTVKLFNMLPMLIQALENSAVLLLDELETSFHPHIAELIIKLFNDPQVNKNRAQLIFSTHNISLMSQQLLRRDQIWLTEKTDGETLFTSLEDFDKSIVKMDSPFSKWYEEGRFGAIPQINAAKISKIIGDRITTDA